VTFLILSNRFSEALTYAAQLHATQGSKGPGVPYIARLLGTASIALEYAANEDEAISALLTRAIEDRGGATTGSRHPPPMQGIPSQRL
jgi:GTP pyrophosphokinase